MFGIKVTIGSTLLLWLTVVASYYVFGQGYREAIHNEAFIGVYTLVLSFVTTYVTAMMLLNNTKLSTKEAVAYLDRGLRVYGGVGLFFFALNLLKGADQSATFMLFSLGSVASGCAAFLYLKSREE